MNRQRSVVQFIVGILISILMIGTPASGQTVSDDYRHTVSLAEGYMQERRFEDAVNMFRQAYEAKPDPWMLTRMGMAFMALGMSTEAEDVFNQALTQGGEISLNVRHYHGWGPACYGNLVISREHITWVSATQNKENFQAKWSDVQKVERFESALSGDTRQRTGGGAPEFRVRVHNKNWRFLYLIYGNGQYNTNASGFILYSGDDLVKADKANALILALLSRAPSLPPAVQGAQSQSVAAAPMAKAVPEASGPTGVPNATPAGAQPFVEQGNANQGQSSLQLKEGQTPDDVEKLLGKPQDRIVLKDNLIYVYPSVKVIFEKGKLVDVQYAENAAGQHQQAANVVAPPAAATIPAGTEIVIRLADTLDSEGKNLFSEPFRATLDHPVVVEGQQVIPKGAEVRGKVKSYRRAGRSAGLANLSITLQDITLGNTRYPLSTETLRQEAAEWGKPSHLDPGALITFRLNQPLTVQP